jgi:OmpA-OmpF porin, OOP family
MKQLTRTVVFVGLGAFSVLSYAATGYVDSSSQKIVRTGFGECVHTQRWSISNAVVECEPEIVAKRDGTDVAAVEVIVVKELKPVRMDADTLFGFDKAELTVDGKARLDDMLKGLTAADLQSQKIRITGHTDIIGDDAYNRRLSEKRAAAVQEYLVSSGVVPAFIETTGVGSTQPVVSCEGKRGVALIDCLAPNRRAEIGFSAMEVIEVEKTVPVDRPE